MNNFDLKKYLAEGRLLKEDESLDSKYLKGYGDGYIDGYVDGEEGNEKAVELNDLDNTERGGIERDNLAEGRLLKEGITSETDKVANEFRKELVDLKNKFDSRLKNDTIYWDGYKKLMKASEGSEGYAPSREGIIPMYLYWMSKYRADKSGKYTKLAQEIEKEGIKLEPLSDYKDGVDNYRIVIK